ncbi:MAG: hypothetical protein WCA24_04250 [Thiomonas sp.]
MAADKGFAAWSLLMPEDEDRRRAGPVVVFFAGAAGVLGATALAATGLEVLTSGALSAGAGLAFPPTCCLTADFFSDASDDFLSDAATAF